MKKNYMKPEANEIEVAANQAVATCGKYLVGYDNSWARGINGQFGWKTPQQAWEAYDQHESFPYADQPTYQGPYVFPVYYGETVGPDGNLAYGTFHDDKAINGVMDAGEYIAWQQNDYTALAGVLTGTNAASFAS